jgi:dGTPase
MFAAIIADRGRLPAKFSGIAVKEGLPRATADYLAGMTDRFALEEHDRLIRT